MHSAIIAIALEFISKNTSYKEDTKKQEIIVLDDKSSFVDVGNDDFMSEDSTFNEIPETQDFEDDLVEFNDDFAELKTKDELQKEKNNENNILNKAKNIKINAENAVKNIIGDDNQDEEEENKSLDKVEYKDEIEEEVIDEMIETLEETTKEKSDKELTSNENNQNEEKNEPAVDLGSTGSIKNSLESKLDEYDKDKKDNTGKSIVKEDKKQPEEDSKEVEDIYVSDISNSKTENEKNILDNFIKPDGNIDQEQISRNIKEKQIKQNIESLNEILIKDVDVEPEKVIDKKKSVIKEEEKEKIDEKYEYFLTQEEKDDLKYINYEYKSNIKITPLKKSVVDFRNKDIPNEILSSDRDYKNSHIPVVLTHSDLKILIKKSIENGDIGKLRAIMDELDESDYMIDSNQNILIYATRLSRYDIMKYIIYNGSNPNFKSSNGNSAMHVAALNNDIKALKLLIQSNANINILNDVDQTPLHISIIKNKTESSLFLVNNNAKLNLKDLYDKTPLELIKMYDREKLKYLLRENNDI